MTGDHFRPAAGSAADASAVDGIDNEPGPGPGDGHRIDLVPGDHFRPGAGGTAGDHDG